jgi:hypothetical protein
MIDVERYLERYQEDTLRKIRPQQIYQMSWFENKNRLYRISREVELSMYIYAYIYYTYIYIYIYI